MPSDVLNPPRLRAEPQELNLGILQVGQDRTFLLRMENRGMRLLYGSVSVDNCLWLSVGDAPGALQKLFQFGDSFTLPVHVRGKRLRARNKPQEGRIVIESNGGLETVVVRVDVPVKPCPDGVLVGAKSPRQVAEKAKEKPKEAAVLFEKGAVAKWYKENGWTYPVQAPSSSGLGAVQQFFEALGLTPPPKVDISERSVVLRGEVGEKLRHTLEVKTKENRPVWAYATSDQPWLQVGVVRLDGRTATIPVVVPSVPASPGVTLLAEVNIIANGNQRFAVAVALEVTGMESVLGMDEVLAMPTSRPQPKSSGSQPILSMDEVLEAPGAAPSSSAMTQPSGGGGPPVAVTVLAERGSQWNWAHLLPAGVLSLVLLLVVIRDTLLPAVDRSPPPPAPSVPVDPNLLLALAFHDRRRDAIDDKLPPSMRFGVVVCKENDPQNPGNFKRLTFDERGRTNNTCVLVNGNERLFGGPGGVWEKQAGGLEQNQAGWSREGRESIWVLNENVKITQLAEIVPGEPRLKERKRYLDTCLVRYVLENQDTRPHRVGIRFLLDTFIGANDGVPYLIGADELCHTSKAFEGAAEVPHFIQALEHDDLANPGTIAYLQLKLPGLEPPSRVILSAWPDERLSVAVGEPLARGPLTMWTVPLLPMKTLQQEVRRIGLRAEPDSAVVIYWDPRNLAPGEKWQVGFAYGLGQVASSESRGKIGLIAGRSYVAGETFTVTALVSDPADGETLTLVLPKGLELAEGHPTRSVHRDAVSRNSRPVTWRVRGRLLGEYALRVQSSRGDSETHPVTIKDIFDR